MSQNSAASVRTTKILASGDTIHAKNVYSYIGSI